MKHLDPAAIDHILAAVNLSANVDPQKMLDDLEGELAIYRTGKMLRGRPAEREQMVARIVAALEGTRGALAAYIEKYGTRHLWPHLARRLDPLIEDMRKENSPELNRIVGFKQPTTVSAVERLVTGLVRIFERHYQIEAGYTDDAIEGLCTGPCVDFIDSVLQAAGINYDRPSITRAMRKCR